MPKLEDIITAFFFSLLISCGVVFILKTNYDAALPWMFSALLFAQHEKIYRLQKSLVESLRRRICHDDKETW